MARSRNDRGVPVHRRHPAAAVAAPVQLVEALDPVQRVLHRAHLRSGERPDLRGGQRQRLDLLGRVTVAEQPGGGLHGDPGEERGQVGEVIVDRHGRHPGHGAAAAGVSFGGQVVAPGGDLARGNGTLQFSRQFRLSREGGILRIASYPRKGGVMPGSPRVLTISFKIHVNPLLRANIRFPRIQSAADQVVAAVTALVPRAFPWAERVEVTRSWAYEWWAPEVEDIQLPATADNTPDEQDDAGIEPPEGL